MPLNDTQRRDRNFALGSMFQVRKFVTEGFSQVSEAINSLTSKTLKVNVENPAPDYTSNLKDLTEALKQLKESLKDGGDNKSELAALAKTIEKTTQKIEVNASFDTSPITKALDSVDKAVRSIKIPENKVDPVDFKPVITALNDLKKSVASRPDPEPVNLSPVVSELKSLQSSLAKSILAIKPQKAVEAAPLDLGPVLERLEQLELALREMPQFPEIEFPTEISVSNFPVQLTPQPVTHFSINALKGVAKQTAISVSATPTALPTTALSDRRSIMVYNNDSDTVYLGDASVTTSTGFPVPPSSYSPSLDMGDTMVLYAVVGTGTADVRVLEISDIDAGR